MSSADSVHVAVRGVAAVAISALAAGLIWVVVDRPADPLGLAAAVQQNLEATGVGNPVTAVLLNFRAYDTLLEVVVLSLALAGVWSLRAPTESLAGPAGATLTTVVALLTPLMMIVGGYLLWRGTSEPGGAFQAGAVVASSGVLLLLSELPALRARRHWLVRLAIAAGALVFIGVGLGCVVAGARFLEYPPGWAKWLILTVETVSTVSIALILAGVFASNPRVLTSGYEESHEEEG